MRAGRERGSIGSARPMFLPAESVSPPFCDINHPLFNLWLLGLSVTQPSPPRCPLTNATTELNGIETRSSGPLSPELLAKMNAYWRAANYLSVGQIYLKDNPLLEHPLTIDHVKPRLLGHWGTTPGLNFLYVHWNRVIRERDLDMIYIIGPGHGGPGLVANTYLEGSYTEIYPPIEQN